MFALFLFCLIFLHVAWHLLNRAIDVNPVAYLEETSLSAVTSLPSFYVRLYRQKERTHQHVLDARVSYPLAAQPQYNRFAIHPAQS